MDEDADTLIVALGAQGPATVATALVLKQLTERPLNFEPRPPRGGATDFINVVFSAPTLMLIIGVFIRPILESTRDWIVQQALDEVRDRFAAWYKGAPEKPMARPVIERGSADLLDQMVEAVRNQQRAGSPYIFSRNGVGMEIDDLEGHDKFGARVIVIQALLAVEVISRELAERSLGARSFNSVSDCNTARIVLDAEGNASITTSWGEVRGGELTSLTGMLRYDASRNEVTHTEDAEPWGN